MNFEQLNILRKIETEAQYASFIPQEFISDPVKYFEEHGKNIKSGEVRFKETGEIEEDLTAVKDLPVWVNEQGKELFTVGKKVNAEKSQVGKSGDVFYEYEIMKLATELGLPCPKPVSRVEHGGVHILIMEKVQGFRWTDSDVQKIKESGLTEEEIDQLKKQAEEMMNELRNKFEEVGIVRTWKLNDMIFELDIPNRVVVKITPVDWERTKIDQEKLRIAMEKK